MEIILTLVLSFTILSFMILIFKLISTNSSIRLKLEKSLEYNDDLKSKIKRKDNSIDDLRKTIENLKKENVISILPGQKAIMPNYGLSTSGSSNKISFEVTYEVDIIDVSVDRVKVRAINYTSNDSYANDVSNKNKIISFMSDKWILKKEIELIISESDRRNAKLDNLLGDR